MKVIFLDVDGVLNSLSFLESNQQSVLSSPIDRSALVRLKKLVQETGARIVLSSSWREGWNRDYEKMGPDGKLLVDMMKNYDLSVMDRTGRIPSGSRSRIPSKSAVGLYDSRCEEIVAWLMQKEAQMEAFVILDDADYHWDGYGLRPYLVKTDFTEGGLLDQHVEQAIKILNNHKEPVKSFLAQFSEPESAKGRRVKRIIRNLLGKNM